MLLSNLKKFFVPLAIVAVLLAGACGYALGYWQGSGTLITTFSKPFIEVTYSGGWLVDESAAVRSYKFYNNGQVVKLTRGGTETVHTTLSEDEVFALEERLSNLEAAAAFTTKIVPACPSLVDAIDQEFTFRLADGSERVYSNCEYTFNNEYPLLQTINMIVLNP